MMYIKFNHNKFSIVDIQLYCIKCTYTHIHTQSNSIISVFSSTFCCILMYIMLLWHYK